MERSIIFTFALLCCSVTSPSLGHPIEDDLSRHEEVKFEGRAYQPPHLLKKEHRGIETDPLGNVMDKVLSSKTASAVDNMASGIIQLAGGVVEDLGDFVVETIDQLPDAIKTVSDAVGKAVDDKREKVLIMVKGVGGGSADEANLAKKTTQKLSSAVQNSQFQSSFQTLEDAFASFLGKFIGVTYKNADNISSALSDGFKRITGSNAEKNIDNLDVLSRSNKETIFNHNIADEDKKENEIKQVKQ